MEAGGANVPLKWTVSTVSESGELGIGTSDTNACYVLPPVLAAFRDAYPGIELRVSNRPSPATEAQVLEREVDIGFVTLPAGSPRLAAEPLDLASMPADARKCPTFAPDNQRAA